MVNEPEVNLTSLLVVKREFMHERHEIQEDYWTRHLPAGSRAVGINQIPPPVVRIMDDEKRHYRWEIHHEGFLYVLDVTVTYRDGTAVSTFHCYDNDENIDDMVLESWVTFTAVQASKVRS